MFLRAGPRLWVHPADRVQHHPAHLPRRRAAKDMVYLRGLIRVLEYLSRGEAFEPLLVASSAPITWPSCVSCQWRSR